VDGAPAGHTEDNNGWTRDQQLRTLEQLLTVRGSQLPAVIEQASLVLLKTLDVDKADIYCHDPASHALVAVATAVTPLGYRQRAAGLHRVPLDNGGRLAAVFRTGVPYRSGHADQDADIPPGFTADLDLYSLMAVPLSVHDQCQGILLVAATRPDVFSQQDLRFLDVLARWIGRVFAQTGVTGPPDPDPQPPADHEAVEELLAVLAHDLRTFLAPLGLRLDMLRRRAQQEERPRDLHDVTTALRALARLDRLITTLLDVARLEHGLFSVTMQSVDLAVLAQETAALLSIGTTPIQVHTPATLTVHADPDALRQALENLLANAVKYSPAGVPVVLTVGMEARAEGEWAVLTVCDRGPGIRQEVLPRLFQRFAVGPGSHGLGLGLYLASEIAKAHGGTLTVDSTPGSETCFRLAWPAAAGRVEAREARGQAGQPAAGSVPVIAVVNDDSHLLELLREVLTGEGYEVLPYASGTDAHQMLRRAPVDVIVLDIRLEHPHTGWQLLEVLRLDPTTAHIPVIVSTADIAFVRAKADHLAARGCAILEKPFTLADLLDCVRSVLSRAEE